MERHCVLIRQQPPNAMAFEGRRKKTDITLQSQVNSNLMHQSLHIIKRHTLPVYLWKAMEQREKLMLVTH